MNEKEAREVISVCESRRKNGFIEFDRAGKFSQTWFECCGVYLEAIEKAKVLEDSIEKYIREKENVVPDVTLIKHTFKCMKEALARWEKVK